MVSTALDARGLKRVCVSCGIRFYDLNKRPIHCPNCNTEFSGEIKLKGRRGRAAAIDAEADLSAAKAKTAKIANDDGDSDIVEQEDGVVSLEDVALEEGGDDDDADVLPDDEDDDIGSLEDLEEDEDLEVDVEDDKKD